jgi:hypothetical protein
VSLIDRRGCVGWQITRHLCARRPSQGSAMRIPLEPVNDEANTRCTPRCLDTDDWRCVLSKARVVDRVGGKAPRRI